MTIPRSEPRTAVPCPGCAAPRKDVLRPRDTVHAHDLNPSAFDAGIRAGIFWASGADYRMVPSDSYLEGVACGLAFRAESEHGWCGHAVFAYAAGCIIDAHFHDD